MKIAFFITLFFSISNLCFASNESLQNPFDPTLQNLSFDISEVVTNIDENLGQELGAEVIDIANVVNTNSCKTQIGEINESSQVEFPAYNIPGMAYNLQMEALLRDVPELSQFREQLYPFHNLLAAYANANGLQNLNSKSSTELATIMNEFARKEFGLHLPKGILLVEIINTRIIREPNNLGLAFGGVASLPLNERTEILHHVINRIDEDPNSSTIPLERTKRMASYFTASGLNQGLILLENHQGVNRYTIIAKDEQSGQFVRNSYTPAARTQERRQEFLQLDGRPLSPEQVPVEFRGIITPQLLSQSAPEIWSVPASVNTDPSPITVQTPTLVPVPGSTISTEQNGVVPLNVRGLNEVEQPDSIEVQGEGSLTFRSGTLPRVQTFSPVNVNVVDTNISEIRMPNFVNPQLNINKEKPNALGLNLTNQPRGNIFETSLATVSQTEGVVLRAAGSTNNGITSMGFGSLVETGSNGSTLEGNGFIQRGEDFGLSGRYRSDDNNTLFEGRSFLTFNTSDNTDPDNPIRGISVTAISNYRYQSNAAGSTTDFNTTLSTDIPVGQTDLIRTAVTVDANDGITNAAGLYRTQVSDTTQLSLSGQIVDESGRTLSGRLENENTAITLTNYESRQGQIQNTLVAGQNLDSLLPDNTQGYVRFERSTGDLEDRTVLSTAVSIDPGIILSEDGRIIISTNDTRRNAPDGTLIENGSIRSFTVMDTIGSDINFDLSYVNTNTNTNNAQTNRNVYGGRLTYGVDRNGNPISQNGGIVGSIDARYTNENTLGEANPKKLTSSNQYREEYNLSGNIGYSERNNNSGSSFNITAGTDYRYEVIRNGGTIVSTTEDQGFRIASEYSRGLQRRQASCNATQRTTTTVAGSTQNSPWECRITFSQRF